MNKPIIINKTIHKNKKKKDRSILGPPPSEIQIRHCMLYEFNKGCNATQATKNICDVYGTDSLKANKCQRWFRRFSTGDFDITNNHRSGRPAELDNVQLKTMVEENPRQTVQEIADKLNASRSTVHEHLKQIEALEHLFIIILVYIFVCLCFYKLIFQHLPYGLNLINAVRFPKGRRVLIVTAHPDDECMFFGPTIVSLTKRNNCIVFLLCLSNGNYDKKGRIRKEELWNSCRILKLKDDNITLVNATNLQDDPNINWRAELIAKQILNTLESLDIEILITFDRDGISQHPNHIAIYYATASLCLAGLIPNGCKIFTLDTINICRKYLSLFDILSSFLLSTNWFILNWNEYKVICNAMRQHRSQLVWFRKLYIIFSRYMIINSLREINVYDIELEMQIQDDS